MCGIYGVLNLDGRGAEVRELRAMARLSQHRGPDDEGHYVDQDCALGMRRLAIIDVAGGQQPLRSGDGNLVLVCNGEIYNYRELRAELIQRGHVFATHSDCEVIFALYREMGDSLVDRLNGMFAFALWDGQRRRLLIARDRLGIKPLYTLRTAKRFAFASEAKALLALDGVRAELNESAVRGYLHLGYVAAPQSMFRGIAKLMPATTLAVEDGKVRTTRYWRISGAIDHRRSEDDWAEEIRSRLELSVKRQMVSDVPLGAFLSGGIDSSAIVCMMAKHSARPVKTYAIGFEGTSYNRFYNELPYAAAIAARFGTEHHEIMLRPDVVGLWPKLLWHMDEPMADSAFIPTYLVAEFARRNVTVALSGAGGDEIFGGYRRYLGGHFQRRFSALPRWVRQFAVAAGRRLPEDRHSHMLNVARYAKSFLAASALNPEERYGTFLQVFGSGELDDLLIVPGKHSSTIAESFRDIEGDDEVQRMLAVDADNQLPDDVLMLTDRMTMAASLECRVPLLDHELVEFAAQIPGSLMIRRGQLKYLMRRALRDELPRSILRRNKRGFGTPIGAWLKHELAPVLQAVLSRSSIEARGLVRPSCVEALIEDHRANRIDGTDRLLALFNLEIWSRIYVDGRLPEDVSAELRDMNGVAA